MCVCVRAQSLSRVQLFCYPMGRGPSSVHGIFQTKTLTWIAVFRGSSPPRDRTHIPCPAGGPSPLCHWGSPYLFEQSLSDGRSSPPSDSPMHLRSCCNNAACPSVCVCGGAALLWSPAKAQATCRRRREASVSSFLGTTAASRVCDHAPGEQRHSPRTITLQAGCPGSRLCYVILNSADLSPAGYTCSPRHLAEFYSFQSIYGAEPSWECSQSE